MRNRILVNGKYRLICLRGVVVGACLFFFGVRVFDTIIGVTASLAAVLEFIEELVIDLCTRVAAYLDKASPQVRTVLLNDMAVFLSGSIGVIFYCVVRDLVRIQPVDGCCYA